MKIGWRLREQIESREWIMVNTKEYKELQGRMEQAHLYAKNCERSMYAAEELVDKLADALEQALDLADEGWAYASDYFRKKWDYDGEREALAKVLEFRATLGASE